MPPPLPERESPEARFAHFRILGALGGGGMGDVYLALDEKLERKVALKLLRPESLWSQDAKLRFHRETLAVGRLDHPNICRLYEAGEHEGRPFMALQYIEGETLAQKIDQARVLANVRPAQSGSSAPATRAEIVALVPLIEQVARALHHAHEQGLVHRDVKPDNIMVSGDGRPVVLDFGLARDELSLEASLSSSRRGVGTPLYMSPEQVLRRGDVDARTDVYSLGVTLYECLTHERPFEAATEAELAEKILANSYENPCRKNRQVPPELGLVLACALDRDPERRYRTALAMAEDLRRVILLQPVHARPIGTALRLRRWVQRNPTLVAVGSLAGAAMLGLGFAVKNAIHANAQAGIALARADEASTNLAGFRLLSDVVQLQDAKASEKKLYPALPEQAQPMRDWLQEQGEPLARRLPTLEAALVELRGKAKPRTPEAQKAQRDSHPRLADLQRLQAGPAAVQHALEVRAGTAQVLLPELDAGTKAKTAGDLTRIVNPITYGQEAYALACARLALSKLEAGDASATRWDALNLLAWACFRNGLDAEALQHSKEAGESAPADQRQGYAASTKALEGAIASWRGEGGVEKLAKVRAQLAALELEVSTRSEFEFEDDGDRFLHLNLSGLVADLRAFTGEKGELSAVRRRLIEAESVRKRSIEDHQAEWEAAISAIASSDGVVASRLYDHLVLTPQIGLVPIGIDPESKLWEFAHLASGEVAKRDPEQDRLVIADQTGIVFVLLPGGTFAMGAQKQDPRGRNYDPEAGADEAPVREVTLSAFFLSKCEMTRGQWQRLAAGGQVPGHGVGTKVLENVVTLHHPVEGLDWTMCDALMGKSSLCIPTEAQWEYGCRAGTTTPWSTGDRPESLRTPRPALNTANLDVQIEGPVGSFAPNAFGLHDTHGNVNEWCRDRKCDYEGAIQAGDGLRLGGSESRALRGGGYGSGAASVRSAMRWFQPPSCTDLSMGLRPARVLTP